MACCLTAPSHYLNQWWHIVRSTLRNIIQWDLNQNTKIFIQENAFENVALEMVAIFFWPVCINLLAPGKFEWNFWSLIFQIISVIDGWGIFCELAHRWISLNLTNDKSTLVQVMAWCHQATSHYLSQCWPRLLSPYGVPRPQWVNDMSHPPWQNCMLSLNGNGNMVMINSQQDRGKHADVMSLKSFLHYWPFVRGIYWLSVDYHHKGCLICC